MPLFGARERKLCEEQTGKSPSGERLVMLLTSEPKPEESLAEVEAKRIKYTGYADAKTTASSWGSASGSNPATISNSAIVSFKEWEAGANEEATWFAIRESAELVGYEKLEAGVVVGAGNKIASFAIGALGFKMK